MCMIRKCFQVQDGAIIVVAAAATTVTTVYNLYVYRDLGEGSWHFLRCWTEGFELCRSAKGRRQVRPGLGEIA